MSAAGRQNQAPVRRRIFRSSAVGSIVGVGILVAAVSAQTPQRDYSRDCLSSGCHAELAQTVAVHSPVSAKECDACHQPAGKDQHKFAFVTEPERLCFECHDEDEFEGKVRHTPFERGECTACHDPHGGPDRMNLLQPQPELCYECHEEVAESVADATTVHGALKTGRKCTGCHNPHSADSKALLLHPPMELCLSCHNETMQKGSRQLANMAALLIENPVHHGPIDSKDCTACHHPHASQNARLLNAKYPSSFYAKFDEDNYALCFGCHDIETFEEERTEDLTAFRNGDLNLHYLHVNRPVKGRTCRACHDPHAAKNNKLIAESVAFGGWRIPLGYRSTPTGGSCLPGCHKPYRYDRENAITNVAPE